MPNLNAETLLNLGFRDIGVWAVSKTGSGLDYHLDGANAEGNKPLLNGRNALYAFVQESEVRYIGKTARTVRQRFAGYRNPSRRQRTNWRCNGKIREQLKAGATVRSFVFAMTMHLAQLRYSDFSINLAAGLEDSLIEEFDPPWNGRDITGPVTEEAERELDEEEDAKADMPQEAPSSKQASPARSSELPAGIADFRIKLGEAYYNQGIINPGIDASRDLGEHDDPISIYLGSLDRPLVSRIDRKANPSGSVRVVGGNGRIAKWMKSHFAFGETVQARVLDRNSILLLTKVDQSHNR